MLRSAITKLFFNRQRGRDWSLEFFSMNEECLVNAREKRALTVSLFLVHTARRSYRFGRSCELFGVFRFTSEREVLRA